MTQEIILTEEEKRQVEKGIHYSRVVAAQGAVLADTVKLSTKFETIAIYKGAKGVQYLEITNAEFKKFEIQKDIDKLLKSIEECRRLTEMWRKRPIHN